MFPIKVLLVLNRDKLDKSRIMIKREQKLY